MQSASLASVRSKLRRRLFILILFLLALLAAVGSLVIHAPTASYSHAGTLMGLFIAVPLLLAAHTTWRDLNGGLVSEECYINHLAPGTEPGCEIHLTTIAGSQRRFVLPPPAPWHTDHLPDHRWVRVTYGKHSGEIYRIHWPN